MHSCSSVPVLSTQLPKMRVEIIMMIVKHQRCTRVPRELICQVIRPSFLICSAKIKSKVNEAI